MPESVAIAPDLTPEALAQIGRFYRVEAAGQLDALDPHVREFLQPRVDRLRQAGILPPAGQWEDFAAAQASMQPGQQFTFQPGAPSGEQATTTTTTSQPGQLATSPVGRSLGGLAGMTAGGLAGARLGRFAGLPGAFLGGLTGAALGGMGGGAGGEAMMASKQPLSERLPRAAAEQGQAGLMAELGGRALGTLPAAAGGVARLVPGAMRSRAEEALTKAAGPVNLALRDKPFVAQVAANRLAQGTQAPSGRFVGTLTGMGKQATTLGARFQPDKIAKMLGRDSDFVRVLYDVAPPALQESLDNVVSAQAGVQTWRGVERLLAGRMAGILETGALLHGDIGAAAAIAAPAVVNKLLSSKPAQRLASAAITTGLDSPAGQAALRGLVALVGPRPSRREDARP